MAYNIIMICVIDTNVMVAGLASSNGASFQLLTRLFAGDIEYCLSVPLFFEYEAVLKRDAFLNRADLVTSDIDTVLNSLAALGQHITNHYLWRPQLRDPKDEMVLETAINGGADTIVTFNLKDFRPAEQFGIRLYTPAELLKELNP